MSLNTTPRSWVAGEVVTAAMLNAEVRDAVLGMQAAWDAWVPTRTNYTLGNGTEVARFLRIGKTITYRYRLTFGSTTTVSSLVDIGLPAAPKTGTGGYVVNDVMGSVHLYDDSVGAGSRTGGTAVFDGGNGIVLLADRLAAAIVSTSNPWAWGVGDVLSVSGTYEAV